MIWSGGMAWIADFPDPANFYYGILGCAGAVEGGWNWSKYCNKDLDARADKADAMVKDDQAAARIGEWKGVFDDVLKDAPWAPIFNEKRFTYHSARLGGDAVAVYRSDPHSGELRLHLRQGRAVTTLTACALS